MRSTFLKFSPPMIDREEIDEVVDTLQSDWITTGPKTKRFEQAFASFVGAPGALALNSCTAALHTALATLAIGPGDEVITTPMTFAASVNVIEHTGARPILADVEPDTLNIDPAAVERALTKRTRAIIAVHFAGHPVELDPLRSMAAARGIELIEDAAHALPARYRGEIIGSRANPVAFSFYATKNLTTGEGGMLTASDEMLDRARVVALHGMSADAWKRYDKGGTWRYDIVMPGFKYNMTDIAASIGLHQLKKLERFACRRQQIVRRYNQAFSADDALLTPACRGHVEHAWHLYVLRIRPEALSIDRDAFIDALSARNVGTSVHFIPIHMHSYYATKYGYQPQDFPVAADAFQRILSLPLHPGLSDADVDDVISAVLDVAAVHRR